MSLNIWLIYIIFGVHLDLFFFCDTKTWICPVYALLTHIITMAFLMIRLSEHNKIGCSRSWYCFFGLTHFTLPIACMVWVHRLVFGHLLHIRAMKLVTNEMSYWSWRTSLIRPRLSMLRVIPMILLRAWCFHRLCCI